MVRERVRTVECESRSQWAAWRVISEIGRVVPGPVLDLGRVEVGCATRAVFASTPCAGRLVRDLDVLLRVAEGVVDCDVHEGGRRGDCNEEQGYKERDKWERTPRLGLQHGRPFPTFKTDGLGRRCAVSEGRKNSSMMGPDRSSYVCALEADACFDVASIRLRYARR